MRCENCQKFVSYAGDEEPEIADEIELDREDRTFEFSVRLFKACADCNTELKETTFEFNGEIDPAWWAANVPAGREEDVEIEVELAQTERSSGGRRPTTFYGVEATVTVTAPLPEGATPPTPGADLPPRSTWTKDFSDEIAAGSMDEL